MQFPAFESPTRDHRRQQSAYCQDACSRGEGADAQRRRRQQQQQQQQPSRVARSDSSVLTTPSRSLSPFIAISPESLQGQRIVNFEADSLSSACGKKGNAPLGQRTPPHFTQSEDRATLHPSRELRNRQPSNPGLQPTSYAMSPSQAQGMHSQLSTIAPTHATRQRATVVSSPQRNQNISHYTFTHSGNNFGRRGADGTRADSSSDLGNYCRKRKVMSSPGESEFKDNEKCRVQELIYGVTAIKIKTPPSSPIPDSLLGVMSPPSGKVRGSALNVCESAAILSSGIRQANRNGNSLLALSPPQLPPSSSRYLRLRYPPGVLDFDEHIGAPLDRSPPPSSSRIRMPASPERQNRQHLADSPHPQSLSNWATQDRCIEAGRQSTLRGGLARRVFTDSPTTIRLLTSAKQDTGPVMRSGPSMGCTSGLSSGRADSTFMTNKTHQEQTISIGYTFHSSLPRGMNNSGKPQSGYSSAMDLDTGIPPRVVQLRQESAFSESYPVVSSRRRVHKKRRVGLKPKGS